MKNKVLACSAIVIIIGIIIVASLGFNVDVVYKDYFMIEVGIGEDFNIGDIKSITKDVLQNSSVDVEKSGNYQDNAIIKVREINDSQKVSLCNKINEKYGTEIKAEDIKVSYIPSIRLSDLVKPYIIPVVIATALILVYMAVRFSKLGIGKVLLQVVSLSCIAELLYFALIAITRYPVNRLTLPVAVIIYMTILTVLTGNFEKQLNVNEK